MTATIRPVEHGDVDAIRAFTQDTWPDRDGGDYLPHVIEDWIDPDDGRTLVAAVDGVAAGLVRITLLSPWEGWVQGMRVDPEHRGRGLAGRLTRAAFEWAREQGATVARNMVHSWNGMGLGLSRAAGFRPVTAFRWVTPEPDAEAEPGTEITAEPDAAWRYWGESDARTALAGLALDPEVTWAVSELTRDRLARAAAETFLGVAQEKGTRGFTYRVRDYERERDGTTERLAEYGVGTWGDVEAAESLLAAVARDAATIGADRTRILIPESVETVSDVAVARVPFDAEPEFVLGADLTAI